MWGVNKPLWGYGKGNKSPIIWLWCLPSQTLSTPRGIAHTNSIPHVEHTELNQKTLQTPPRSSLILFNSIKSPKATAGKPIHFQPKKCQKDIVFAGQTGLTDQNTTMSAH